MNIIWRISFLLIFINFSTAYAKIIDDLGGSFSEKISSENQEVKLDKVIFAANYPLQFFASKLLEKPEDIIAPVLDSKLNWAPDKQELTALKKTKAVLLNGARFENWLKQSNLPKSKLTNTTSIISGNYIIDESLDTQIASITWLDLRLAKIQLQAVYGLLLKKHPKLKKQLKHNYQELDKKLDSYHQQLRQVLSRKKYSGVIFAVPSYHYFARGYNLFETYNYALDPQAELSLESFSKFKKFIEKTKAKSVIFPEKPDEALEKQLGDLKLKYIVLDLMANRPLEGDYFTQIEQNIANLKQAL